MNSKYCLIDVNEEGTQIWSISCTPFKHYPHFSVNSNKFIKYKYMYVKWNIEYAELKGKKLKKGISPGKGLRYINYHTYILGVAKIWEWVYGKLTWILKSTAMEPLCIHSTFLCAYLKHKVTYLRRSYIDLRQHIALFHMMKKICMFSQCLLTCTFYKKRGNIYMACSPKWP